jgi:UDP-glucose 4-epimerase
MRVVVVGATGNVGSSVVSTLASDPAIDHVVGAARRPGGLEVAGLEWARADIRTDDLDRLFAGADAVVHLAWLIQPSHRPEVLRSVNVTGTRRLLEAVQRAQVPALIYASSVGTYAPGPKHRAVDERWPASGIRTCSYSVHKAEVEGMLDRFERSSPEVRVVRLRPGLIFKRGAAAEIRRYFLGRFAPVSLARRDRIPVVPDIDELRFQVVHTDDAAEAYRLAVTGDARGAFNIAADPVLDPKVLAQVLGARRVRIPSRAARALLWGSWRAHLQPTSEGWLDMALSVPIMDTGRARRDLGWEPTIDSTAALLELMEGLRNDVSLSTPVLRGSHAAERTAA